MRVCVYAFVDASRGQVAFEKSETAALHAGVPASLHRLLVVWVSANKELWAAKSTIQELEQENQGEDAS